MNESRAEGKFDQIKGKVKESVGEAVGNERLANSGAADQVKGHVKESWGATKDAAHAVANDSSARTTATDTSLTGSRTTVHDTAGDTTAHDVRQKIVSTAQNVKDAITGKSDEVRDKHRHSA